MRSKKGYTELFSIKYNASINASKLPVLKHTNGLKPCKAHLLVAGKVRWPDGSESEYQDIRVFFED